MLSLPELSKTYITSHPHYHNPLAYFDPSDKELTELKRAALLPYLEKLEDKLIIYNERFLSFAVLFDVVTDENGFRAQVYKLNELYVPNYAKHLAERKNWSIGTSWQSIRLLEDKFNSLHAGWSFWPEERVVSRIEQIYLRQGQTEAQFALQHTSIM